jgi:Icc-related predicted phosphoesterase
MKIIGLTDIHGKTDVLHSIRTELREADLVVVSGDITHFGDKEEASRVKSDLQAMNEHLLLVHGNCDRPGAEAFFQNEGISLHGRVVRFGDIILTGAGGSLPCPGMTPNEHTEEEYALLLTDLKKEIRGDFPVLFVTHQPPFGTVCDHVRSGGHVGSQTVRMFIQDLKPSVCFTGHIHEGVGLDFIGMTAVTNPGPLNFGGYVQLEMKDGAVAGLKVMRGFEVIAQIE